MGAQGEGSKGEENSSTLFFVAALVVAADEAGAGLLGVFFHQERRAALRAGLRHRPVPEGEVALGVVRAGVERDRKSTRLNSSHLVISYAVFCLKKKKRPPPVVITDRRRTLDN